MPLSTCIIPKFYIMDGEGDLHTCNGSDSVGTEKILWKETS